MKTFTTLLAFVGATLFAHSQIGIGTTSPQAALHIEETGSGNIFLVYDQASDTTPFIIDENGNVAIKSAIDTNYSLMIGGRLRSAGIEELSDARYKIDVLTISDALDKVMALRGVSYRWNQRDFPDLNFKPGSQIGLIAQELEMVVPEAVNTDSNGFKSVEYSHLVGLLVEAIKQQQDIIANQDAQLKSLAEQVEIQNQQLKKINALLEIDQ